MMRGTRRQLRAVKRWVDTSHYGLWIALASFVGLGITQTVYEWYTYRPSPHFPPRDDLLRGVPGALNLCALFVLLAFRQYPVSRAIRRIKRGQCTAFGYDLRGSAHSETCPECGESITRKLPDWYVEKMRRRQRGPSMPDWWLKKPRR